MQLSGRIEEKSKEKKRYCIARTVFSAGATGETQSKEGLVQNAASPGPGVCGQGGAGDGHWSPISVPAVECSSLGSGVEMVPLAKNPSTGTAQQRLFLALDQKYCA